MSQKESILIIEDEPRLLRLLEMNLESEFKVTAVSNGAEALSKIGHESFDVILSDIRLPGASGMDILKASIQKNPETPVILVTAFGTVENAVEAMKIGAFDYLVKPVKIKELKMVLERALQIRALRRENKELRKTIRSLRMNLPEFITVNPRMQAILKRVREVAPTAATVLIQGKSGTGKELIAQMIHRLSDRSDGPFVPINCAAIPQDLLESELFGHEKGAFTGAIQQKKGKYELANGGTFFLDEIAELPMNLQAKLLRVLETHQVSRVGGTQSIEVDVRVISATNQDLQRLVREGGFREDLFYRLNVVKINLPELQERRDDIPVLVNHFLQKYREQLKKDIHSVSPEALRLLLNYSWPGNVRELENVVYRAVLFAEGKEISPEHLPEEIRTEARELRNDIPRTKDDLLKAKRDLKRDVIVALEQRFLENVLQENGWNISRTARAVGMDRRQLQNMIRRHKIEFPSGKG